VRPTAARALCPCGPLCVARGGGVFPLFKISNEAQIAVQGVQGVLSGFSNKPVRLTLATWRGR
jgi:hypothetical protein